MHEVALRLHSDYTYHVPGLHTDVRHAVQCANILVFGMGPKRKDEGEFFPEQFFPRACSFRGTILPGEQFFPGEQIFPGGNFIMTK